MSNFLDKNEQLIFKKFVENGYIIEKTKNISKLNLLQNFIVKQSAMLLDKKISTQNSYWLNNIHDLIIPEKLNQFRLSLINAINDYKTFREIYFFEWIKTELKGRNIISLQ